MGNDPIDQILKLTRLMGAREVVQYIRDYRLNERRGLRKDNICFDIIVAFENGDIRAEDPSNYEEFINKGNEANCTWEALDLVKHLLTLDYVVLFLCRKNDLRPSKLWNILSLMMSEVLTMCYHLFIPLIFLSLKSFSSSNG